VFESHGSPHHRYGRHRPADKAEAENMLEARSKTHSRSRGLPDLKATRAFSSQSEPDTEDNQASPLLQRIVRDFNIKLQVFPTNLFASMLGFSVRDFFEVENQAEVEKAVEVKF
jgi:LemA protein